MVKKIPSHVFRHSFATHGCKSRLLFAKIAMAIWFRSHGLSICKDKRLPTVLIYTRDTPFDGRYKYPG